MDTVNVHPRNSLGTMTSFDPERLQPGQSSSVHSVVGAGNRSACCMSAASLLIKRLCGALQWGYPIDDNWSCRFHCLTGKATDGIVDRLLTVVYTPLSSGPSARHALPERDEFEHSHKSTNHSIMPLCQNRGPAKGEWKGVRIRSRVGGQRCRHQQLGEPASPTG